MSQDRKPTPPRKGAGGKPPPKKGKGIPTRRPGEPPKREAKGPGGAPPSWNWNAIRREYVQSDEDLTLKSLSREGGRADAPAYDTIKDRAAAENWTGLRHEFRHYVAAETQRLEASRRAENRLDAIDKVRKRHAEAGKALIRVGAIGLEQIMKNPADLKPVDVARFMAVGSDMERKARGMEEVTVRLADIQTPDDLKKLTVEEILELRRRRRLAFGIDAPSEQDAPPPAFGGLGLGTGTEKQEDREDD